jgi:Tol biopolymer transport system component
VTDERWQLAFAIYEAAAALAETERQAYIRAAAPDQEIADKVLDMLEEVGEASDKGSFPERAASNYPTPESLVSSIPTGTSLGRFVITGFVGQGGMGRVYSAHDPDLNREAALKVITPKAEPSNSERFIREAQAASALNHPNIVTVYEVIRSGPTVAIAMELVTGTSLRHHCGTAQPVEKLALWGRQIAYALAEAHARGIVHRDIKPENLMLRPDGYIKVLDFGLARRAGVDRPDDELALGTLGYMSPEEIEQRPITAASDIFSLGVVLYELASGTNPFRGESADATTRMILGLAPPPLPERVGAIPKELDRLVRSMLNKSAADRPSALEVAPQLEAIAIPRAPRRGTTWAAAALGLCVIGGGIAAWRGLPLHRADDKAVLLQSVPLDSEPASETAPAFSPDGGTVAYGSDLGTPGIHHIVTRSLTGLSSGGAGSNQALTLTSAAQDDFNPVWSPDASRIAFLRRIDSETLQAIVIPAGGGPEHVVAILPGLLPGARKYLTWTPDGKSLIGVNRPRDFTVRLYRYPVAGGPANPFTEGPDGTEDVSPSFSPDGRWFAFLRWRNGATYELWTMAYPGGKAQLLTTSPVPITSFSWRPDGRNIVYGNGVISKGDLWQIGIEGNRKPQIAPFVLEGASDQITIAPKQARMAYVLQNLDANILRLPLGRSSKSISADPEKLFPSIREELDPAYSPDGNSIAFISNRSGQWNLWTGRVDGSGLREFPAQSLLPFHPAWSPDGKEIAFDAMASGKGEIWLVSANGGNPRLLVAPPGGALAPSWSTDGRVIRFISNRGGTTRVWEIPAKGGEPVLLTRGGSYDSLESPDGKYLYFAAPLLPGIRRIPLAPRLPDGTPVNQTEELIRETLPVSGHRFWTLGQGGIYFVDAQKRPALLKFVSLDSRKVTVLATLPKLPAKFTKGLSISPDGRYVLYCQDDLDRYEIRVVANFR